MERTIRRGDIFMANLNPIIGSEQGGIRPVLILSNNLGNTHGPTVIAAPITSRRHKKAGLPTHAQIPVQARLGRLPYSYIQKIDKALAVSIGLWDKC